MAEIARKAKRCPSDLTDENWARIKPLVPKLSRRGRPPKVDLREVVNALRYLVRFGCGRCCPSIPALGRPYTGGSAG